MQVAMFAEVGPFVVIRPVTGSHTTDDVQIKESSGRAVLIGIAICHPERLKIFSIWTEFNHEVHRFDIEAVPLACPRFLIHSL